MGFFFFVIFSSCIVKRINLYRKEKNMAKLTNKLQYKFDDGFNKALDTAIHEGLFWRHVTGMLYFDGENIVEGEPSCGGVYLDLFVIPETNGGELHWNWPRRINCKVANTKEETSTKNLLFVEAPIQVSMDKKLIKRSIALNVAMALGLKI